MFTASESSLNIYLSKLPVEENAQSNACADDDFEVLQVT